MINYKVLSIAELERMGAILGIQDGNHGEKHPKASDYVPTGIPFIMASDLRENQIDFENCKYITRELAASLRIGFARTGDVLLTHKGTVGSVAIVPSVDPYIMLTPQVTYYRVNPKYLDSRYLAYAFRHQDFQHQLGSISAQSTRPYVGITTQRHLKIHYCPLSTQRRIASILAAYDDLIENNTRRIKILEQMAQALYREWFVEFRAPGVKLRKATSEEQKVTGKDRFPVGWELRQLGDIAQEVRRGVQPDQIDPETPYFGLEHLPRKSIALSDWGTACEVQSTKLAFKRGEILFGKIRPYFHKVGVAPVDGVCSSDTIVIVPKLPEYFALTLTCVSSEDFVTHATQTSQGTKMPRANWDVLIKYGISMPPEPMLKQFNALIQDIVDLIINMVFRNRNLRQTRDLLLPRLVGGEIEV
jgi:type I restriction enzyme, S subunit